MRIIKTVIKNRSVRITAVIVISAVTPLLSIFAADVLPDAYKYISEAAKYSSVSASPADRNKPNNGNLMLYIPEDETKVTEAAVTENPPQPEKKDAVLLARNISETEEDLSVYTNNSGTIYEMTYDGSAGADFINLPDGGQVRNCTDLSNEFVRSESLKDFDIQIEPDSELPQVLIIHTHTTESYEITEKNYYDEEYICRSDDPDNSVVAVGRAIAEQLSASGIAVIHDGTIHDSQYTGAYSRSLETTERILEEFPSIKIVLDIHRDAIEDNGDRISAVTEIDGKKAAQVMIISAADDGTYDMPHYLENFHFACALQQSIESRYPTLTRPVLFQYCHYNQHVTNGSLLLEVGSHGNTIDQAVYTGELIGKALAGLLIERTIYERPVIKTMPRYFIDRLR